MSGMKLYWNSVRKIQSERGVSLSQAREIYHGKGKNGHSNGHANGESNGAESPVLRKVKAARALVAECGGLEQAAELIETMKALA